MPRKSKKLKKIQYVFRDEGLPGVIDRCNKKTRKYLREILKDTTVKKPESFMIEVTNLCNLRCITCAREYEFGKQMDTGSMDFEKFKKVIDEIAPYARSIALTGLGETLLYRHLVDATDYIHARIDNPEIFISTNANLPNTTEILENLSGKINTVQVSIDGVFEKYNEIRLKGDYQKFIKNVRDITQISDIDFIFNMVVLGSNYMQMTNIIEVAHDLGIKQVHFNTFNLAAVTTHEIKDYELYVSEEFLNEYSRAVILASNYDIVLKGFDFDTNPGFKKCPYPWDGFYITWDGYLVPCCAKPFPLELNFGNVFNDGVIGCINSENFQKFRKKWYANDTPAFCKKCHMIEIPKVDIDAGLI